MSKKDEIQNKISFGKEKNNLFNFVFMRVNNQTESVCFAFFIPSMALSCFYFMSLGLLVFFFLKATLKNMEE